MTEHVKAAVDGGVMTLTLARPDKKNALSSAMYEALVAAMAAAEADAAVRVVVFAAEGDAFTAGNDIGDFAKVAMGQGSAADLAAVRFIKALAAARKPCVAAVQGRAVGIGLTMLLHCDLVYVAEDARLSAPFVDLALVPEAASSLLLPALIGHQRAFAVFALGQSIGGGEAAALGLANAACAREDVLPTAMAAARALAAKPAGAVAMTKSLMRDAQKLLAQIDVEVAHFGERLNSEEASEAFRAFAERRPPRFHG